MENLQTPVIMVTGGIVIKYLIDIVAPLIPEQYRRFIPILALMLWMAWAMKFLDVDLAMVIYRGILTGVGAVGLNETTKVLSGKKKGNTLDEEVLGWALDLPDPRDRQYNLLAGSGELPRYVNLGKSLFVQNQWDKNDPDTGMACVDYATSNSINGNNTLDDWGIVVWGNKLRAEFIADPFYIDWYAKRNIDRLTEWSYVQHWADFARKREFIIAYFLCKTNDMRCKALADWHAILTGSSKIDWKATKKNNGIAVAWTWAAHSFTILGYDLDKEWSICMNSRGNQWGDKGFFYIPFDIAEDVLFSAYALIDRDDKPVIDDLKAVRDARLAVITLKIFDKKKLSPSDWMFLRNWGLGHLIPKK